MLSLDDKISDFEFNVSKFFSFLEIDYSLKKGKLRQLNMNELRDAEVYIRYKGGPVEVDISWGIGTSSIGITLRDTKYPESQLSIIKEKNLKPVKVIYFELAVEYITNGKIKPIFPEIHQYISFEQMKKNAEERTRLIENSFDEIIIKLADKLKKYGRNIIEGDTHQFPEFEKYYTEKYY